MRRKRSFTPAPPHRRQAENETKGGVERGSGLRSPIVNSCAARAANSRRLSCCCDSSLGHRIRVNFAPREGTAERTTSTKAYMPVKNTAGSSRATVRPYAGLKPEIFNSQQRAFVASRIPFSMPNWRETRNFRHKGHATEQHGEPQPATTCNEGQESIHRSPCFRATTTVATQSPESQRQDRWAT